jgi:hypothetical protein
MDHGTRALRLAAMGGLSRLRRNDCEVSQVLMRQVVVNQVLVNQVLVNQVLHALKQNWK